MMPSVPLPAGIRTPIDFKLKPKWRFDRKRRVFVSPSGETFKPHAVLPKKSRIVHKAPGLAEADEAHLSKDEKNLRRHMQLILPADQSPADYLAEVRGWPAVAEADVAPDVALPSVG